VPQVACFDTGFHRGHAAVATLVPLPSELRRATQNQVAEMGKPN
jgi:acetate kinase